MGHGIILDDPDSVAKAFTDLKIELDKEKTIQKVSRTDVDMMARAVKDLKILLTNLPLESPLSKTK
jgi:hypothetical protein